MSKKIIVIGGVAAGASAATKARRDDENAVIIIYEKGPYVSFANCGLPYYVGRDIQKREDLLLMTPEKFKERYNIDVKLNYEVVNINKEEKYIEIIDLKTGKRLKDFYDKLVIATGGTPIKPPIRGINLNNICTLFTIPDVDTIEKVLAQENIERVAVIGAGFIGLEAVEAFLKRGKEITLVEKADQLMPHFDKEMVVSLKLHLEDLGVKVITGDGVKEFKGNDNDNVSRVILESGREVPADLVIFVIGAKPQLDFIKNSGLTIGSSGGILVDASMRTSDPDIYAGGDIIETVHLVTRKKVRIPLAGPANKQGRVIGANVVGGTKIFKGVLGTSIVKVGELTAGKTGISEKEAKREGIAYFVSYTPTLNHAVYYPGAKHILTKLVVEQHSGRILGAQCVGWNGVDKRIDVFATAIYHGMTVEDLEHLDLAYAPPYSSARDPVIIAGYVAANILRGECQYVTPEIISNIISNGKQDEWQIVDIRKQKEYERDGFIPGAVYIPMEELRKRYLELDPEKNTVLYCKVGYRGYIGYKILKELGFKKIYNLSGGYLGYKSDVRILHEKEYEDKEEVKLN